MWKLAALLTAALHLQVCFGQLKVPKEPNVLTPPYFNIATGKKIESTATCGVDKPQVFCKLTGGPNEYDFNENLYQGQFCDKCDSRVQSKAHPIKYAIDGTEKWWQSPPLSEGHEYNKINITIHLGQVFHVAYILLKFANSPRAGTWVLERSSDHGATFQPWQYFANSNSDCHNLFGIDAFEEITSDNSVICTSEYSDVVPLEGGEVIVSMINHRPGAKNFSHSPVLQEWSKATDIRLRLLRTKTLLGHLMAVQRQDPTVTRRYFYSIKDISVGGRCVCNGHADTCVPDPHDKYKLKCECRHHTCGDSCEQCCPGFVQKAWRAAIPESANECEACNCFGHSTECIYDEQVAIRRQSLDLAGNYEGGGVCQNCAHNTAGINCEKCVDGYYRPANVDPRAPDGCRPCDCNSTFTVGTCEPVTGRCYCKPKYAGDRCDKCAPGYHQFPECEPCPCYYNGTRDGVCLPVDDVCPCKYNYAGKYCDQCSPGFYNFPECVPCDCGGVGAVSAICDIHDGQCECEEGFGGLACDQCSAGYYNYPVCQACSCFESYTTEEVCNPDDGTCFCVHPVTGPLCNQCKPGYYGFPQCNECDCDATGSVNALCNTVSGRCECKPNFSGPRCDECAPEFYDYPNCVACDCNTKGSQRTTCDPETGDCTCFENIEGRKCDQCSPEYFNFPRCEDCKCNPLGITQSGHCSCKENVVGIYCDSCAPLHYNLTLGCIDCNCLLQGTLDGVAACDSENGDCWCKPYTCTQRCSQCDDGFYSLEERNYFGCTGCQCNAGGSMSQECEKVDGQCPCKAGVTGRECDTVQEGYYYPTLLQPKYEVEDGRTVDDDILRFGFDQEKFPSYSLKGYGEFSVVQRVIIVHVSVDTHGLYKIQFSYANPGDASVANVTLTPVLAVGSEQKLQIRFEESATPALLTGNVVVLNEGQWDVTIEGDPGLLIDYIALLPSSYYEPSIFQAKVTEPCVPKVRPTGKECLMYEHPPLDSFPQAAMIDFTDREQHDTPTTAHPPMVHLLGNSIDQSDRSVAVSLSSVPSAGKYVLVLVYASDTNRMQTIKATVTDGAGQAYDDVKFNIYPCLYSFLCRQVALTTLNNVYAFDMSIPNINVVLSADAGESVYVKDIYAIPFDQWTMEYVEPKRRCVTNEGPAFEECIAGAYSVPSQATKIDVGADDVDGSPGTGGNPSSGGNTTEPNPEISDVLDIGSNNNPMVIDMNLEPGRYVFVLHYLNKDHTSFTPDIVISGGILHYGGANITYCPDYDGCRAVVTTDNGDFVLDINSPTQTMTITVPDGKSFSLDYVLAIPEESYDPSVLDVLPLDLSRKYFDECYSIGTKGASDSSQELPEFCKTAIFSLTTDFNNGALPCDCSGEGTIGGAEADCEDFGGQCPCKPGVIGRNCDRCRTGYFGFPDCQPCNCNGSLCDEINGNCICPPNTVQPGCDKCVPFTHSFHPLAGCEACNCHPEGVENDKDLGCSQDDGQCRCKENVEGIRCDKCASGFYNFPNCRPCVCNSSGIKQDGCDSESGQCTCKDNVVGQQCDRCKAGTFHLDGNNPLGCTACFCFGVTTDCAATQYPLKEIIDMEGWRLLNMKTDEPEVLEMEGSVSVDVVENGGAKEQTVLYWAAPKAYLGQKIGSYGGKLRFSTSAEVENAGGGRGDNSVGTGEAPGRLSNPGPTVILEEGRGLVIQWTNARSETGQQEVELIESNFVHQESGEPVKREEMMLVLERLESLRIKATDYTNPLTVTLAGVSMTTTDYDAERESGETIPTVEICTCPPGYTGNSCEMCDLGYFRDRETGPYLGYCVSCDCNGHCDYCLASIVFKCKHHTTGDRCEQCEDGYIGNATSGEPDACQPCPCPYPNAEGNFASKCEYDADNNVVCTCKPGYSGEKCDQCAEGYFGNPSVIGDSCKQCNCHGNLDPNLVMETCDPITGQCKDCQGNTGGKYCERCADGFFGDALTSKNCTKCPCDECGTLQCDHTYGHCACKAHVIGFSCDRCEPGYWNLDTCRGCMDCDCAIGAIGDECDADTGKCVCAPNVIGQKCDKCAPGHWNYSPLGCKPCNCRNDGDCNPANGECTCPPGITGPQCDQCKLERHVLSQSGLECESCDSCTHDLLNDIEPLTDSVKNSEIKLSNVSAGVAAAKQLESLRQQGDEVAEKVSNYDDHLDNIETEADKLLQAANGTTDESGDDEYEASGDLIGAPILGGDEEVDSYTDLVEAIDETENKISSVCNKSQIVLENVSATNARAVELDRDANDTAFDADHFLVDAEDLLSKLTEESTGDSEEYLRSLTNAQMLITKMNERTFDSMQSISDAEVIEAEALFQEVNVNFTAPSDDLEGRWNVVSDALTEKSDKMKEMRKLLNNASKLVTETDRLNAANRNALSAAQDAIDAINKNWRETNDAVSDIKSIVNRGFMNLTVLDTDELSSLISSLEDVVENDTLGLVGMDALVNKSLEHASNLTKEAAKLDRIIKDTEEDPRNVNAFIAANRYQTIVNTMNEAETAASAADLAATEAAAEVAANDLEKDAETWDTKSGELLNTVQGTLSDKIPSLRVDLVAAQESKDVINQQLDDGTNRLNSIKNRISGLNPGELDSEVRKTKEIAGQANELSDQVEKAAAALEDQINSAPNPDDNMGEEFNTTIVTVRGVKEKLDQARDRLGEVKRQSRKLARLPGLLGLDATIAAIKKRIELSRDRAGMVSVAMRFRKKSLEKEGVYPEYAQVNIPQQAFELTDDVKIELQVNISDSSDNSLLYLGNDVSGDYLALETILGKVHYRYKAGDASGELESDVNIADQNWHRIVISRTRDLASLTVYYPRDCRGDSCSPDAVDSDFQQEAIAGDNVAARLPMSSTPLIIGGMPLKPVPAGLRNIQMNGCMKDVKINSETVGIWNFVSYNGPYPGKTCSYPKSIEQDNPYWRFRGVDSYVKVDQKQIQNLGLYDSGSLVKFIGFKFLTKQKNELFFLVGSSFNQFYALELKNGKFVFTYNFGFPEPRVKNATVIRDYSTAQRAPVLKFGFVPPRSGRTGFVILLVNNQLMLKLEFEEDWSMQVTGSVWIGGIHMNDQFDGLSEAVTNLNRNFRGCISQLKLDVTRGYQIYNADERVGVTIGCTRYDTPVIDDKDKITISIATGYPVVGLVDELKADSTPAPPPSTVAPSPTTRSTTTTRPETRSTGATLSTEEPPPPPPEDDEDSEQPIRKSGVIAPPNVSTKRYSSTVTPMQPVPEYSKDVSHAEAGHGTEITAEHVNSTPSVRSNENMIARDMALDSADILNSIAIEKVKNTSKIHGSANSDAVDISEKTQKKPKLDLKDSALVANTPDENSTDKTENDINRPTLPILLIIIGFIVGVVLVAALISAIKNGNLFGTATIQSPQTPPASPEQTPLRDVQAQQVAQMDW